MSPSARTPRDILILPLAALVALGWSASLVAAMLTQDFIPLEATSPAMLLVLGYTFGVQIVKGSVTRD